MFGPYPFETAGAIADNARTAASASRWRRRPSPYFDGAPDEATIAHELAHQWFGDCVSVHDLAEHLAQRGLRDLRAVPVDEHTRRRDRARRFAAGTTTAGADAAFWTVAGGRSQRDTMFASAVYRRGAMTLQALREKIGDDPFFRHPAQLDRRAPARQRHDGSSSSLAERISGQDLSASSRPGWCTAQARVGRRSLRVTAPPLRFGIVSTAGINIRFWTPLPRPGGRVVAVSSRDAGRAAAYAREQGIPRVPRRARRPDRRPGGRGGVHLGAERAARRVDDGGDRSRQARALREAADTQRRRRRARPSTPPTPPAWCWPRRSCTATTRRSGGWRSRCAEGEVGALRSMRSAFGFTADRPDDILLRPELDGGGLLDVGCYCVSAFRLLAGEPKHVRRRGGGRADGRRSAVPRPDGVRRRRDG